MEEEYKKTFDLLEKWMELKKISKREQIKYYQSLVLFLEQKEEFLHKKILFFTTGGMAISSGVTCLFLGSDMIDYALATFLIISGMLIGTVPLKQEDPVIDENYEEEEEQRNYIKKLCRKRKD